MKKVNVFLGRFRSKITLMQSIVLLVFIAVLFFLSIDFIYTCKHALLVFLIIFLYFSSFIFITYIALNKTAENLISKKTTEILEIVHLMLSDYYTLVLYEPTNQDDNEILPLRMNALFKKI